jgi:processive 1,2-diacylglycerol beta-glucosyltransferase
MRILIATVTAGAGHLAAATAMEEAWRSFRPKDALEQVDLVTFFSPLHRKVHADGYLKLAEHAPEIWGMVFKKTDNVRLARRLNKFKQIIPSNSRTRFARYVKEFKPDVVVCTHYLPLEILAELKKKSGVRSSNDRSTGTHTSSFASREKCLPSPFVVSIVTDFEAHALWMEACVDLYCVAAEETKARLIARGATPENIVATGIPISAKFSATVDKRMVRRIYGLRDDQPVLLILSGGFGMGPVAEILTELDKVKKEFQMLVVTGRNQELRKELAPVDRKHPTHILGFASNMHELMAVSDLVISKPGGLTSSEVLAMGKPLLIINPIPGQEAANSDFLLERGAAAKVNRVEDLPYRIETLLGSKKLSDMAKVAHSLGRPGAALAICAETVSRLETRVESVASFIS